MDDTIITINSSIADETLVDDCEIVDLAASSQDVSVREEVINQNNGESSSNSDETAKSNEQLNGDEISQLPASPPSTPTKPPNAAEEPKMREIVDIKFKNRKTYLAFQEDFVKLFKKYYKNKLDDLNIIDSITELRIQVQEKVVKKNDIFLIDTTPNLKNLESSANSESTPYYKSAGKVSLDNELDESKSARSSGVCFNCGKTTHSLRDCPEPRNMRKINQARNEFRQNQTRYHNDTENSTNFTPGMISDELRQALGLQEHQVPSHVYRMRLFGYPPGWLEEAKVQNSGLAMFVEPGKRKLNPDEDEGETETIDFKYDVQQIHEFPGFNVIPTHQFQDLYGYYQVPPMSPAQLKETMIQSLGDKIVDGYKRVKLRESGVVELNDTAKTDCDMEVESLHEEQNITALNVSHKSTPDSPTEDLEEGELSDDAKILAIPELSRNNGTSSADTSMSTSQNPLIVDEEDDSVNHGIVASTIEGCPVLESFSGFSDLPKGDNFKVGVSDVIAFENLADSTGKFEHMKGLINKVRAFQKHHLQE